MPILVTGVNGQSKAQLLYYTHEDILLQIRIKISEARITRKRGGRTSNGLAVYSVDTSARSSRASAMMRLTPEFDTIQYLCIHLT